MYRFARSMGSIPSTSSMNGSHPRPMSKTTRPMWPHRAATCMEVRSRTSLESGTAPAFSSATPQSTSPLQAAACRGDHDGWWFRTCTLARLPHRMRTTLSCPCSAATNSAVAPDESLVLTSVWLSASTEMSFARLFVDAARCSWVWSFGMAGLLLRVLLVGSV